MELSPQEKAEINKRFQHERLEQFYSPADIYLKIQEYINTELHTGET